MCAALGTTSLVVVVNRVLQALPLTVLLVHALKAPISLEAHARLVLLILPSMEIPVSASVDTTSLAAVVRLVPQALPLTVLPVPALKAPT